MVAAALALGGRPVDATAGEPSRHGIHAISLTALVDAGVDVARAERLLERLSPGGLPDAGTLHVFEVLTRAAERGLPVLGLVDKAEEGVTKRIPASRIAGVLEGLVADLEQAAAWVSSVGLPEEGAVVEALSLGVAAGLGEAPAAEIAAVAAETSASAERVAAALQAAAGMGAAGLSPEEAGRYAGAWLARGWPADTLRATPGVFRDLVRHGRLAPAVAAGLLTSGVEAGLEPEEVRLEVLGWRDGLHHGYGVPDWLEPGEGPPEWANPGEGPPDWVDTGPGPHPSPSDRGRSGDAPVRTGEDPGQGDEHRNERAGG